MYICHACRRVTRPTQLSTESHGDLTCTACGVAGFVEEIDATTMYNNQPRTFSADDFNNVRRMNPFTLLQAFTRDVQQNFNPSRTSNTNTQIPQGFTVIQLPTDGVFGLHDVFLNFLPDGFAHILTPDNLDNLVNLILTQGDANRQTGPPPASEDVLNRLPNEVLDKDRPDDECPICLKSYKAGDSITYISENRSKCPHYFHTECIMPWLKLHNTCCVCRYQLPTDDQEYEAMRQAVQTNLSRTLSSRVPSIHRTEGSTSSERTNLISQGGNNNVDYTSQQARSNRSVVMPPNRSASEGARYNPRGDGDEPAFVPRQRNNNTEFRGASIPVQTPQSFTTQNNSTRAPNSVNTRQRSARATNHNNDPLGQFFTGISRFLRNL